MTGSRQWARLPPLSPTIDLMPPILAPLFRPPAVASTHSLLRSAPDVPAANSGRVFGLAHPRPPALAHPFVHTGQSDALPVRRLAPVVGETAREDRPSWTEAVDEYVGEPRVPDRPHTPTSFDRLLSQFDGAPDALAQAAMAALGGLASTATPPPAPASEPVGAPGEQRMQRPTLAQSRRLGLRGRPEAMPSTSASADDPAPADEPIPAEPAPAEPVIIQRPTSVPVIAEQTGAEAVPSKSRPARPGTVPAQPVTSEQSAATPIAAPPPATEPTASKQTTTEPITARPTAAATPDEPITSRPLPALPVAAEPIAAQPDEPIAAEPTAAATLAPQPVTNAPAATTTTARPIAFEPTVASPDTGTPTAAAITAQPIARRPAVAKPPANEPTAAATEPPKAGTAEPATVEPAAATAAPVTARPIARKAVMAEPVATEPTAATAVPVTTRPITAQPTGTEPGTTEPTATTGSITTRPTGTNEPAAGTAEPVTTATDSAMAGRAEPDVEPIEGMRRPGIYRAAIGTLPPSVERVRPARVDTVPADIADVFRSRFGLTVADVPIHRGPAVSALARAVSARAFTQDGIVHLPDDAPPAHEPAGRGLLAHELVHAVQQRTLGTALPAEDTADGRPLEAAATSAEEWFRNPDRDALPTHRPCPASRSPQWTNLPCS